MVQHTESDVEDSALVQHAARELGFVLEADDEMDQLMRDNVMRLVRCCGGTPM